MTTRRSFLASVLAAGVAPWITTRSGVLMPVRRIAVPVPRLRVVHRGLSPGAAMVFSAYIREPGGDWRRHFEHGTADALGVLDASITLPASSVEAAMVDLRLNPGVRHPYTTRVNLTSETLMLFENAAIRDGTMDLWGIK